MSNYEEPNVLCRLDRSFGEKKEELRLEQGEYEGKPTYALRVCWQGHDDKWRWAQQKPSQNSGKCWQQMHLKAGELQKLGEALIAAARGGTKPRSSPPRPVRPVGEPVFAGDDDIPF
jgi:hypothetical protein